MQSKSASDTTESTQRRHPITSPFLTLSSARAGNSTAPSDGQEANIRRVFGYEPDKEAAFVRPGYTGAAYEGGAYTPGRNTPGQFTA